MNWSRWSFEALDTFFFRGGVSFHAGEGGYSSVQSLFPPFITTLQGAIRYSLAIKKGWTPEKPDLWPEELGDSEDLGKIQFRGPYIFYKNKPYFSTPLLLLKKDKDFLRLVPGSKVRCDLGEVRLPFIAGEGGERYKVIEGEYISREGIQKVIQGGLPNEEDILPRDKVYFNEPRIGLERSDETRTAKEGHLYYVVHVRPEKETSLGIYVGGIPDDWDISGIKAISLGGEGRLARVEINEELPEKVLPSFPQIYPDKDGKLRFFALLITPGWFEKLDTVILQGPPEINDEIHSKAVSACIGKAQYIGGWNLKEQEPRPLVPVLPPGSLWFYEVENREGIKEKLRQLHGQCLGEKRNYGFSQIIIGRWEEIR
ncbi:type III-B CRISPR module-associated Cmr3 family protein [Caldanaerobacter sp.]|uniref:type III-B CRISPR module-associated Cmr3 family protein n=1 Tax=Caldanaerobacter sp. TaxID=2930036 RepID=UPI003C74A7F3